MTITVNITNLFTTWEPWDCSNSVANLGSRAAELTWNCAMELASKHAQWLLTPMEKALELIRHDAGEAGAWTEEEINDWSEQECLTYLVQVLASDMRMLGSDDLSFKECLNVYETTNWDQEPEYPSAVFYLLGGGDVGAEWGL